ncbi:class E sortase [Streptomyces sp. SBC-4]|nr:class E sortase [Streptomyces sp. SBC-4]MDV5143711.1 class E sortase [Streptomyces sp. SBC-4]
MAAKRGGSLRTDRHGGRGPRRPLLAAATGVAAVVAVVAALAGCAGGDGSGTSTGVHGPTSVVPTTASSAPSPPSPPSVSSAPSIKTPPLTASVTPATPPAPSPRGPVAAEMSVPSIGVENLDVTPYEGTTDDRAGTRIQDRGVAASPYGERGGVGPGEIGNYLVTAHRLSAGGPLRELPSVEVGDLVHVTAEGTVYTYEIVETRTTSFRSARSLAEQRAAVPGEPGEKPTRAMITLSTCATPEDNAAGNFWRDAQNNPEHRIDKIGVLTSTRSA